MILQLVNSCLILAVFGVQCYIIWQQRLLKANQLEGDKVAKAMVALKVASTPEEIREALKQVPERIRVEAGIV
jgi:hypothetical protein